MIGEARADSDRICASHHRQRDGADIQSKVQHTCVDVWNAQGGAAESPFIDGWLRGFPDRLLK